MMASILLLGSVKLAESNDCEWKMCSNGHFPTFSGRFSVISSVDPADEAIECEEAFKKCKFKGDICLDRLFILLF